MQSPHTFHVPVMGTCFTTDSPLRVAKLGISTAISLVDDILVEQLHEYWAIQFGVVFTRCPVGPDARANRIRAYLDFVQTEVDHQIHDLRNLPFASNSELDRYFQLLPTGPLKDEYERTIVMSCGVEREVSEAHLRTQIRAGEILVNIMTKIDASIDGRGRKLDPTNTPALSALRGFAESSLRGGVIFSAGMNARLYSFVAEFEDFYSDAKDHFNKEVILKVTDFRSAKIQASFMAKRGLWVSEFRVESGLNCGGHAFVGNGTSLGQILDKFQDAREELRQHLFKVYTRTLNAAGRRIPSTCPPIRLTAQGGVGSPAEAALLRERYGVDSVGWGSPFLLVPEVTTVDDTTRERLATAKSDDVWLSDASPLGVRFWNLRASGSEQARRARIASGRPGSPCPKGLLRLNTEFGDIPLCPASRGYQKLKLASLGENGHRDERESVLNKSCICHELAGAALRAYGIDDKVEPAICPGPSITAFSRIVSLEEMLDHIYGRGESLILESRLHFLIEELRLNYEYLRAKLEGFADLSGKGVAEKLDLLWSNLLSATAYYRQLALERSTPLPDNFVSSLAKIEDQTRRLLTPIGGASAELSEA